MQIYQGMQIALSKVIKMSRILEMISLFRISLNSIENISGHCCHINSRQTSGNIVNEISSPILMLLDYTLWKHFYKRFPTIQRIQNPVNTRSWFEWYHFFNQYILTNVMLLNSGSNQYRIGSTKMIESFMLFLSSIGLIDCDDYYLLWKNLDPRICNLEFFLLLQRAQRDFKDFLGEPLGSRGVVLA